ncbi:MFS general substrate transporter [Exidia glandulosa HHB12029]|uniref:MFS general substrate transporter n=1 Tax=Exidia glandulosa HHB12029 TaxID=1314781 RepID=A0A165ZUX8_EXIGL|nr:MFS general substrate transporter [Exidia glandulosa HHB12029]
MPRFRRPKPESPAMELHALPADRDEDDKKFAGSGSLEEDSSELPAPTAGDAAPDSGVRKIEAIQAVWGATYGKYILWSGLAMMMIIFELDNATLYNYQPYATSAFHKQSLLAALQTMQSVVTAAAKPPIAKLSDVIGRAEAYCICITFYIISYIICASAKSMDVYAGGMVFYSLGQTGTQVLNQILLSDISPQRWRGFVLAFSYFPFLVTPWVSASIVQSVITGIGWRWGYGMFAILMPFCASFIIIPLFVFQGRAKRKGLIQPRALSPVQFFHETDILGTLLLCGGAAMILIPISLASTLPKNWSNPRIDVLLGIGGACLLFPFYERKFARFPIVPLSFFKNTTIVLSCALAFFDGFGFSATHAYLYSFVVVTRGWDARHATYLVYINGVVQCLIGIGAGWIMYKTRRYKYLIFGACLVRTVGYGVMLRLRGASNATWELYIVQCIQGIGSGVISSAAVVAAQVAVSHAHLASVSAFFLLTMFIGSSTGYAVAGAIYTNKFRGFLHHYLPASSEAEIETVFNSITGTLPAFGTPERDGINNAYSDVLRLITWAALGLSFVMPILALCLKNGYLGEGHNGVDAVEEPGEANLGTEERIGLLHDVS